MGFLASAVFVLSFTGAFFLVTHILIDRPMWAWVMIAKLMKWKVVIVESETGGLEYGRELVTPKGKRVFKSFQNFRSDVLMLDNEKTQEYCPRDWSYY